MGKDILQIKSKDILKKEFKGIKEEIIADNIEMVRDYVKGLYWYRRDLENEVEKLQKQMEEINVAVEQAENGNFEEAKKIKVPAKFLSERTVRLNDLDWEEK